VSISRLQGVFLKDTQEKSHAVDAEAPTALLTEGDTPVLLLWVLQQ
jgi:hypothetical protein